MQKFFSVSLSHVDTHCVNKSMPNRSSFFFVVEFMNSGMSGRVQVAATTQAAAASASTMNNRQPNRTVDHVAVVEQLSNMLKLCTKPKFSQQQQKKKQEEKKRKELDGIFFVYLDYKWNTAKNLNLIWQTARDSDSTISFFEAIQLNAEQISN